MVSIPLAAGVSACFGRYSGCQKNVALFKRFFLQPYNRATVYTSISLSAELKG
jgi:hypothetical protein